LLHHHHEIPDCAFQLVGFHRVQKAGQSYGGHACNDSDAYHQFDYRKTRLRAHMATLLQTFLA
jgi:hypothetical protein